MNDRRKFLRQLGVMTSSAAGAGLLPGLPAVTAQEAATNPQLVSLDSGIEPTVRLIEETPREKLLELIGRRIQDGISYQEVLAGLMLAGVRNVQPRPAVGFKFHSVLVVNSAHLASLASPDQDRWLPILWALDYFKATQREEAQKSGWHMPPADETRVPPPTQARAEFLKAMNNWDAAAADAAVAGLARTASRNTMFELFCRLGARDYRSIGHKAIYVANSFRTLECIGWQHAEPVLRSLAFALVNHEGEANPSTSDLPADRPWRRNQELLSSLPASWLAGKCDPQAARELAAVWRECDSAEAVQQAVSTLNQGQSARCVWDAVLLAAGELLMRQPGIIGLHSLTTANALHYAFSTSADETTRQLMLLQACAFLPLFRESAMGRGKLSSRSMADVTQGEPLRDTTQAAEQIFAEISQDRVQAAQTMYQYLQAGGDAQTILDQARRLVFLKGRDAHDYKFSSAVLEDYYHVSPQLRDQFLALSVFNLRGSADSDNQLVARMRTALA